MAVRLEFIDVLVPVHVVEDRYPGGLAGFVADHRSLIGRRIWHDGVLVRDGALDPAEAMARVEQWRALGVEPLQWVGGRLHWKELCVIDAAAGGPTARCGWLDWDPRSRVAWLRGTERGATVGRW